MKELLDASMMKRSLIRMAHEIIEKNKGVEDVVLIGIKSKGVPIAKRLCANIEYIEGITIPFGELDVRPWRDDIKQDERAVFPELNTVVQNKKVILVDDVLYKGRTVRAAMDAIMYYGRAKEIQLAVLVDRGHRELPIRADFVGKNIPTSFDEQIVVKTTELDGVDGVYLFDNK